MIRVIGLGSPFAADRVGWQVVERLRGRVAKEVDLVTLDRPGATLVNWMPGVDRLLLVDAIDDGGTPGRMLEFGPSDLQYGTHALSSHQQMLVTTLRLAEALGCRPPSVRLFGITIDPAGELDAHTGRAAEALAQQLAAELDDAATRLEIGARHAVLSS